MKASPALPAAFAAALLAAACGRADGPASRTVRIMDALTERDVARSPFFGLADRFPKRELTLRSRDLVPLDRGGRIFPGWFAFALPAPVMPGPGAGRPPEMTVRSGSARLPYLPGPEPGGRGWSLLKKARPVPAGASLALGERWSQDVLLSAGRVTIRVRFVHLLAEWYRPRLGLSVDGRSWGGADLDRKRSSAEWSGEVPMGIHRLELSLEKGAVLSEEADGRNVQVRLEEIELDGASDLLFLGPEPAEASDPEASWSLRWVEAPPAAAPGTRAAKNLGSLIALQADSDPALPGTEERGRAAALLKKLRRKGASLDVILAAPPTELSRTIRLPAAPAALEFGCGIVPPGQDRRKGAVLFRVLAESGGRRETVFEKTVSLLVPPGARFLPRKERVDLSAFASRKVRLIFRTEWRGDGAVRPGAAPAFWHNPVVFRPAPKDRPAPPNVILISLDTLRADHLGCYGYPRDVSPRLDALAADSIRFDRALSASSWTLPAHMSLLTGRLAFRHHVLDEYHARAADSPWLPDLLRERGYVAGAFTGGGYVKAALGFGQGFDVYEDEGMSGKVLRGPDLLAGRALDWIGRNADKPFFLFLHTYHPHDPYRSPQPAGARFTRPGAEWTEIDLRRMLSPVGFSGTPLSEERRANVVDLYDGDIAYADEALVGPVVDGLKKLGLYDRSLIVATSDHGEEFYEHGAWFHGTSLYEEVLRVPLLLKLPAGEGKGRVVRGAVPTFDVTPTILDALGVLPERGPSFDGRSLLPLARGGTRAEADIVSELYSKSESPLVPLKNASRRLSRVTVIEGDYKLHVICRRPDRFLELYDLKRDPGERTDLSAREPQVVKRLLAKLEALYASGPRPGGATAVLNQADPDLRRSLQALGYVDN